MPESREPLCPEPSEDLLRAARLEVPGASDQVVKDQMSLLLTIAESYKRTRLDVDDRVEAGKKGLEFAVQKYDSSKYRFTTFATHWIRQSIQQALREA